MLLLNQGDLSFTGTRLLKVISFQPCVWIGRDFTDGVYFQQALGANANPFDFALLGNTAQVLPLQGFVVTHDFVFVFVPAIRPNLSADE